MLGVRVPCQEAENARKELIRKGVFVDSYKPIKDEETIVFPVSREVSVGDVGEYVFEAYETTPSFEEAAKDILSLTEQRGFISSYDTIGDIAIIQVPDTLAEKEEALGEALLRANPGIQVVRKRGDDHAGKFRLQNTIYVAGEDRTETEHVEHGVRMALDVDDVYFSPRLSTERGRYIDVVEDDEEVLVLFSGCGAFGLVIAKHTEAQVTCVEWNPEAHRYAEKNIVKNKLLNCYAMLGEVTEYLGEASTYTRVLMPAPHNAEKYVEDVVPHVADNGSLHVYGFKEESSFDSFAEDLVRRVEGFGVRCDVQGFKKCGQKSPGVFRVCVDLLLRRVR